jgi:hypothetical protein
MNKKIFKSILEWFLVGCIIKSIFILKMKKIVKPFWIMLFHHIKIKKWKVFMEMFYGNFLCKLFV